MRLTSLSVNKWLTRFPQRFVCWEANKGTRKGTLKGNLPGTQRIRIRIRTLVRNKTYERDNVHEVTHSTSTAVCGKFEGLNFHKSNERLFDHLRWAAPFNFSYVSFFQVPMGAFIWSRILWVYIGSFNIGPCLWNSPRSIVSARGHAEMTMICLTKCTLLFESGALHELHFVVEP